MTVRVRHEGIELRTVFVPVAERHVDEVTRQGHERGGLPDRVERDDHHRVGQDRRPSRCRIDADDEHVEALVRTWAGGRCSTVSGEARRLEDPGERVAEGGPVPVDGQVRQDDEGRDDDDTDDAQPAGRALSARVEECLTDGEQPPREDQRVQGQQSAEHDRRDGPCGDAGRRLGGPDQDHDGADDQRRDQEEEGEPASAIEGLTETGDEGRQAGGEQPAAVDGSGRGCGPDPGCVHDGRGPPDWCRVRPSLPEARKATAGERLDVGTPGGRSACHDHPASGPTTDLRAWA